MEEKHSINKYIAQKMRARRAALGITQAELAYRMAISPQQIQKYESGKSSMSVHRLLQICRVLEVKTSYFLDHYTPSN